MHTPGEQEINEITRRKNSNGQYKYRVLNVNIVQKKRAMKSLDGLISVLIVRILFLQTMTRSTSEVCALSKAYDNFLYDYKGSNRVRLYPYKLTEEISQSPNDRSTCNGLVSHRVSHYVPYTETYRTKAWGGIFYQIKTRLNYKIEYHTMWSLEHKCCDGYRQVGASCKPHCVQSCERGSCVEPNVCMCDAGHQMSNDTNGRETCLPVCANGCVNGTCVEPDVCSCNEGYWLDSDGISCHPVCYDECERNHGLCVEPHVCSCRPGYRKTSDDQSHKCEPVCDRACTNGHCTAPNVCKCADGYVADEFDPRFTCRPKCNETCVFGACTAPETCTCDDGYKATNASVCEPICGEPCWMGVCVAPESCSCNDGYGLFGSSRYVCEPICEADCGNGTCTAPGVCTCDEGFFYDDRTDRTCKPRCETPCGPNGECASPDNCTCFEGYRAILLNESISTFSNFTKEHRSVCQPVCDFDCVNGECSAPNTCRCVTGYYPSWVEPRRRAPSLDNSTTRICEPACNVSCGANATCVAPDVCACKDGYAKDVDGRCAPLCAQSCLNGRCTEPNHCTCDPGFAPRNESACEPICERGCQNGDCVAPNRCVCHDDFVPNTGYHFVAECIPACIRNCSGHGVCVIDDEYSCECHLGWTGSDCDQPTMCVVTVALDHSAINRIAVHNDTNSTIMQAHENAPFCYQCDGSLNNKSLCYMIHSDEANMTSTVACLLNTDLPCYTTSRYNDSSNDAKVAWPLAIVAVLIATALTAVAYLMYRKHQKKKLIAGTSTNQLMQDSFVNDSLLSENAIYL